MNSEIGLGFGKNSWTINTHNDQFLFKLYVLFRSLYNILEIRTEPNYRISKN